jgi:hypothetical protein
LLRGIDQGVASAHSIAVARADHLLNEIDGFLVNGQTDSGKCGQ